MKKTILALLIGLFSINGVWADDNDTNAEDPVEKQFKKDFPGYDLKKALCLGHWAGTNKKPDLSFGYDSKDCFNLTLSPVVPKDGKNHDVEIERGRDGYALITAKPIELIPKPIREGNYSFVSNIGYVIDFPWDNWDRKLMFTPQMTFDFSNLRPVTASLPKDIGYSNYLVFQVPTRMLDQNNKLIHRTDVGMIFDIRVGRGGGNWKPVTQIKETVEGGEWKNTKFTNGRKYWYYADLRVRYVIIDPTKTSEKVDPPIGGSRASVAYVTFQAKGLNGVNITTRNLNPVSVYIHPDYIGITVTQKISTCSFDSKTLKNRTIYLSKGLAPKINLNHEQYAGSFDIGVDCQYNKIAPKVFMTFSGKTDGAENANNGEDLLQIQKGNGQATGIALQIRKDGVPIQFGPESRRPLNKGQFLLSPVTGKHVENHFDVYYYKTGAEVTPGKVKARATFTFSYQ